MPQEIDSQYDALVETYADVVADRLAEDPKALYEFCRETLIDYYENMTEHELIEHIVEMEDDDEIVTSIYGNYPITDQEIEGRDYHQYSLKEGESISFPVHKKWGSWIFLFHSDKISWGWQTCQPFFCIMEESKRFYSMTVATATKPAAPRKRRARKVTVKAVKVAAPKAVKVTTPKRPSAAKLISPQRYWSDVKTRWAIHQYEITMLVADLTKLNKYVRQFAKWPWIVSICY